MTTLTPHKVDMNNPPTVVAYLGRDCATRERVFVRIVYFGDIVRFEGISLGYGCTTPRTFDVGDLRILDRTAPEPLHWMPRDLRVLRGLWMRHGRDETLDYYSQHELCNLMRLPTGDVPDYITNPDG